MKNGKTVELAKGFDAEDAMVLAEKSKHLQVWAFTNEYKGRAYLHIREVYRTNDEEWAPSNKGISFPIAAAPAAIKKLGTMRLRRRAGAL